MFAGIKRFLSITFGSRFSADSLDKDPELVSEVDWYEKFSPVEGNEYNVVRAYAEKKYEEITGVYAKMDQKAEWCFGLAVAAAGASLVLLDKHDLKFWGILPAITAFALSMHLSLRARLPGVRPSSMAVKDFMEREENTQFRDAWVAASLHCAICGIRIINSWKTHSLAYAARLLIAGVLLLFGALAIEKAGPFTFCRSSAHPSKTP